MKASNLGVVFGPTLMRPERESVATIVDIKYQNIIVEEMIEQMNKVGGVGWGERGEGVDSWAREAGTGMVGVWMVRGFPSLFGEQYARIKVNLEKRIMRVRYHSSEGSRGEGANVFLHS